MSKATAYGQFGRMESDLAFRDLNTLLNRLQAKLPSEFESAIPNRYELQKFKANFEYARTLLLTVERASTTVKIASNREAIQADLREKRSLVKGLQSRIQVIENNLDQTEEAKEAGEEDTASDKDVPSYAPHLPNASHGRHIEPNGVEEAASNLESTLRARKTRDAATQPSATTTGTSYTAVAFDPNATIASREKALSSDRAEQDDITASLLALTQQLKAAQTSFHGTIVDEKQHLEMAVEGLDRNLDSIDAAGKKMGMLRRMTEGKGWMGRMMLYAYIAGLWLVAFLLVFVGPKIRF